MKPARILLLFIFLAAHSFLRAQQLYPAKEIVSCLFGLKDQSGKWKLLPSYQQLSVYNAHLFLAKNGDVSFLLNAAGENISGTGFDEIQFEKKNNDHIYFTRYTYNTEDDIRKSPLFLIRKTVNDIQYFGLVDSAGKTICETVYRDILSTDHAFFLTDSSFVIKTYDKKWNKISASRAAISRYFPATQTMVMVSLDSTKHAYMQKGVIRENGDTVVPFLYDEIFSNDEGRTFITRKTKAGSGQSLGLYSAGGRELLPADYENIYLDEFWNIIAKKTAEANKLSEFVCLNSNHQTVLRGKFEHVSMTPQYITGFRNDSSVYFHLNGSYWFALQGWVSCWDAAGFTQDYHGAPALALITWSEKEGIALVDSSGKKIIPQTFDDFDSHEVVRENGHTFYPFRKGEKYFLIRGDGKEIGNGHYDTIETRYFFHNETSGEQSSRLFFLCKKGNLYETYGTNGKPFFREKITSCISDYTINGLIFTVSNGVLHAWRGKDSLPEPLKLKLISQLDPNNLLYRADTSGIMQVRFARGTQQLESVEKIDFSFQSHDYARTAGEKGEYFVRRDGSGIIGPLEKIEQPGGVRTYLVLKNGSVVTMRNSDSHFMNDSSVYAVAETYNREYYWIKSKRTPYCGLHKKYAFAEKVRKETERRYQYMWNQPGPIVYSWKPATPAPAILPSTCDCGWAIADSSGRKLTKNIFGQPFTIQPFIQPAYGNNGAGLFDGKTMRFVTGDMYYSIKPLVNHYFMAVTNSGKTGIIDSTGKIMADTSWSTMQEIFNGTVGRKTKRNRDALTFVTWYERSSEFHLSGLQLFTDPKRFPKLYLLEKPGARAIFDGNGTLYTRKKDIDSLLYFSIFPGYYTDSIFTDSKLWFADSICRDSALRKKICNFLIPQIIRENQVDAPYYENAGQNYYNTYGHRENFQASAEQSRISVFPKLSPPKDDCYVITYASDSAFSVENRVTNHPVSYYDIAYPYTTTTTANFYLDGKQWKYLKLSALAAGDTAAVFQKLLLESLSEMDNVNLDCILTDRLFSLCKGNYHITRNALIFVLMTTENGMPKSYSIPVPWNSIEPYAGIKSPAHYFAQHAEHP